MTALEATKLRKSINRKIALKKEQQKISDVYNDYQAHIDGLLDDAYNAIKKAASEGKSITEIFAYGYLSQSKNIIKTVMAQLRNKGYKTKVFDKKHMGSCGEYSDRFIGISGF